MDAKAINILLVEDSAADALMLRAVLEDVRWAPFNLVHVERLGDAMGELRKGRFDVAILDMNLPDSSGLEGLAELRKAAQELPILLLTGLDDEETAVAAVERGAQDYLVKGKADGYAVARAIRYAIVRKRGELLQIAKEEAEAASRAKDQFLAMLSHELRNPLTPVLAIAGMLEADPELPERYRNDMHSIRRNVEMETRLIDDLLDITRIVRGKLVLHKETCQLSHIIQRAADVCQADIVEKGIRYTVDLGKDAAHIIEGDPVRLQQVFWNLLKNAVKFTPHGGSIHVRCRLVDDCVLTEITDSGVGITPENLARIFNAFDQGDPAITRQFGGLGLGLAISRTIVEMHGGKIAAHSPGKNMGATFEVRLPVSQRPIVVADDPRSRPGASRPLSVLVVEDHSDTRRAMTQLLKNQGHTVMCAGSVSAAAAMLDHQRFDLLISDMQLPDGSGLDLIQQVHSRCPKLPALALSGFGRDDDIERSRRAGFADHLVKPICQRDLLVAIARALGT